MAGGYYYLITSLPALGELGSRPPMTPAELIDRVGERSLRDLLEALFLGDDLVLRESLASGEVSEAEPTVLLPAQIRDEAPLPEPLAPGELAAARRVPVDALWERYYRWLAEQAARLGSMFLRRWVGFEVGLRNALTLARAKALDLDAADYLVAEDLADAPGDFARPVQEWSGAQDAMEGLKVLDRFRWEWIASHDAWFSFGADELAAYAARLMLLNRWQRLESARAQAPAETAERTQT